MFLLVAHFQLDEPAVSDPASTDAQLGSDGSDGSDGWAGSAGDQLPAVPADAGPAVPVHAREALAMLAASPECARLRFGRSTDVAGRFVLTAEFASAADYRRSLSPWPMRTVVVPWLSTAEVDTSAVHEVLLAAEGGRLTASEPTVTAPGR